MTVLALPARGEWLSDAREPGRALRVTWHSELDCVVLSTWRGDACVGTVQLTRAEAARLVAALADGLAAGVPPGSADAAAGLAGD